MLSQYMITKISKQYDMSEEKTRKIVEVCENYGITPKGDVFRRTPSDIEKIIAICKENKINPEKNRSVFYQSSTILQEIINVCKENNIEIEPNVFRGNPKRMRESAEYIKSNYGAKYVILNNILRDVEKLKESMPVYQSLGLLPYTLMDSSVFDLTRDEIFERAGVLKYLSVPVHKVVRCSQVDRINRVFTLSKEAFEDYCDQNCVNEKIRKYHKIRLEEKVNEIEERRRRFKLPIR